MILHRIVVFKFLSTILACFDLCFIMLCEDMSPHVALLDAGIIADKAAPELHRFV